MPFVISVKQGVKSGEDWPTWKQDPNRIYGTSEEAWANKKAGDGEVVELISEESAERLRSEVKKVATLSA